jgi:hypothetical protein
MPDVETDPEKNPFLRVIRDEARRLPAGFLVAVGHLADVFELADGSKGLADAVRSFADAAGLIEQFEPPDGIRFAAEAAPAPAA